ncbi:MAG TPA: hypothetical protein VIJ86_04070 [Acidimicrobiales bacterium]
MGISRKTVATFVIAPLLATGSLALLSVAPTAASAVTSHSTMTAHSWTGKITTRDAKVGSTGTFGFVSEMKTYTVHYSAMTKFEMGCHLMSHHAATP